jgi:hypothetical protein
LRRQLQGGRATPPGSSRVERLDPFALPVRFTVNDKAADERVRLVELTHERVVMRRAMGGIKMAVSLPMTTYLGVAIRMEPPTGEDGGAVAIVLEHRDPALSLPLYRATDGTDIVAEWQSWARALRLPLLVAEVDGTLREPFDHIGALRVACPIWRRRRRTAIKTRRPSILLRRKGSRLAADAIVHCGEREIVARS